MKLLWLDLETTGLDPQRYRLLEVAALVTDLTTPLRQEGSVVQSVLPVADNEDSDWDAFIKEMHGLPHINAEGKPKGNSLILACKERELELCAESPHESVRRNAGLYPGHYHTECRKLEEQLLALIPKKADVDRNDITALAGSSVHFDLSFLRVHMPLLAANLSHRVYDVSAVKLFCRSLGMPKPPPEEAHRALPDVLESMRHAQMCMQWLARGHNGDHGSYIAHVPLLDVQTGTP